MCYYVVEGQLTFTVKSGEEFTLTKGDCVLWTPGDGRSFVNKGDTVTDLLVVIAK